MESLAHITPRWEWRIFSDHPLEQSDLLHEFQMLRSTQSEEHYLLLSDSSFNLKVRNDHFEIKQLIERSPDQLEKWLPVFKSKFPIIPFEWEQWPLVSPLSELLRNPSLQTVDLFLKACRQSDQCKVQSIRKLRQVYSSGTTHFDSVILSDQDDRELFSMAIEDEDANLLRRLVEDFGFSPSTNMNYVRAMQKLVDS